MNIKKIKSALFLSASALVLSPHTALATTVVPLTVSGGITFENPTFLDQVENTEILGGAMYIPDAASYYKGILNDGVIKNADVSDHASLWSGYFRFAQRLNDKLVVSLDAYDPFLWFGHFGPASDFRDYDPFTRISTLELSPRFSYQITPKFSVGAGFRAIDFTSESDFGLPPPPFATGAYTTQNSEAWGYGWSAGASYSFSQANVVYVSFFSRINIDSKGSSASDTAASDHFHTRFIETAQWVFDYFHAFNEKWMAMTKISLTKNSAIQNINLKNVATGPDGQLMNLSFPVHLHDSWNEDLSLIYVYNEKLTLIVGGSHIGNPFPNEFDSPAGPGQDLYVAAVGARYQATKNILLQPSFAYLWSDEHVSNIYGDKGHYKSTAPILGLTLIVTL